MNYIFEGYSILQRGNPLQMSRILKLLSRRLANNLFSVDENEFSRPFVRLSVERARALTLRSSVRSADSLSPSSLQLAQYLENQQEPNFFPACLRPALSLSLSLSPFLPEG